MKGFNRPTNSAGLLGLVLFLSLTANSWAAPQAVSPDFTITAFATVIKPVDLAFDGSGNLFVGRQGSGASAERIYKVSPDGLTVTEFGDPIPDPDAVIVDIDGVIGASGSVLVGGIGSIGTGGHITLISPDGLTTSTLVATSSETIDGPSNPQQFAFTAAGELVWGNCDNPPRTYGTVSALVGGVVQPVADAQTGICYDGIAISSDGHMFLTDLDGGNVLKFSPNGDLLDANFVTGLRQPQWMAYDAMGDFGNKVLVSEVREGRILSIDPATGATAIIAQYFLNPFGITIGPDGCLYVAEYNRNTIWRMCRKRSIYWANAISNGKVMRVDLEGLTPTMTEEVISTGLNAATSVALDLSSSELYFSDTSNEFIKRAPLTGSPEATLVNTDLRSPISIALDLVGNHLYWSNNKNNFLRIERMDLDDVPNSREIFIAGATGPIAIDAVNGHLYWGDRANATIYRATLDGSSQPEDLGIPIGVNAHSIALDMANGYVYWTNDDLSNCETSTGSQQIQRCPLDSCISPETIVEPDEENELELARPFGLALDLDAGKLYWSDECLKHIGQADLDGGNPTILSLDPNTVGAARGLVLAPSP